MVLLVQTNALLSGSVGEQLGLIQRVSQIEKNLNPLKEFKTKKKVKLRGVTIFN